MPIECLTYQRKLETKEKSYLTLWINLFGNVTDQDFETFTKFFTYHLEQPNLRCCVFFDLRHVDRAPLHLVFRMGHYMIKHEAQAKARINSSVILITPHRLLEPLLRLLFSIKRPANPNLITNNLKEGWAFLDQNWMSD